MLGFTAQQQALDALAAVRGHHDQVAPVFLGGGNDGLGNQVRLGNDRFGADAFGRSQGFDCIDNRLARLHPLRLNSRHFTRRHGNAALKVAGGVARHDGQADQFGVAQLGQGHRMANGFFGQVRAICGHENTFVHGSILVGLKAPA